MNPNLSKRIKEGRLELGYNQPELAKIMKVSKQTVSNWENGNRTPDADTLSDLADLFNCSVDYLLGRTDEKKGVLFKYDIDGNEILLELSKDVYPEGLTKEEVIDKLKILKKMEEMGIKFPNI